MDFNNYYLIIGNVIIKKNICLINNYKIYKKINNKDYVKLNKNFILKIK